MRRGHRAPARPPLLRRAVVALVEGDAAGAIDAFRRRHHPLAHSLPAHVTLVFPFASTLSALQVATHVGRVAACWPAIPACLRGVGTYHAEWVHLRMTHGAAAIVELHDRLHRRALAPFLRADIRYEPHVTIGRAADAARAEAIVRDARSAFVQPIDVALRALTAVALPPGRGALREFEVALG